MSPTPSLLSVSAALPNFLIVGAPKAGTTSLYHYLDQHPQVFMSPIKEPNYFASEIRPENCADELQTQVAKDLLELQEYLHGPMQEKRLGGLVSQWDDYLRLFQGAKGEKAIGEASVCYLWSKTAAANIRARIPGAKIIMILRNPADVAFSLYLQSVSKGLVRGSFRKMLEDSQLCSKEKFSLLYPFLELGLYYEPVKRFLELFPRENVLILWYEQYQAQQQETLANIFRFLNVDTNFVPDTTKRYLEPKIPRFTAISYSLKKWGAWQRAGNWTPTVLKPFCRRLVFRQRGSLVMDNQDKEWLYEYYREDIQELSKLVGRDLTAWQAASETHVKRRGVF
jgi:Sulfotransferase domain